MKLNTGIFISALVWLILSAPIFATEKAPPPPMTLITNASIFDGVNADLATGMSVLVEGNKISKVAKSIPAPAGANVIDAKEKVLMPGLIDAHWHVMLSEPTFPELMSSDAGWLTLLGARGARDTLYRGFTTVRDVGGNPFAIKKGIDKGMIEGPRIYPSGPNITQTSGHSDGRHPAEPETPIYLEHQDHLRIADGKTEVLKAVRQNLRMGATQIKLSVGGGVSSNYDPLDVSEYTFEEIKAAVDAAQSWNTYVAVHANTDASIRTAIEAGAKSIEHGFLLEEDTLKLMAKEGIWLSIQPLLNDEDAFTFTGENQRKWIQVTDGTNKVYKLAKKHNVKTAFGTDLLFDPTLGPKQGKFLAKLKNWYTPYEALKMATSDNAELIKMCGPRDPYPGEIGVVKEGALADLILVDGNPLENLDLVADPDKNFVVIMKDGVIYKNTVKQGP
ncbi:metal-dependent hydrolase family protein [Marinobacter arenosus]|uniref:metal-dependent hydrolase family protein n=1 Tax=Marinobacter arenosus TaxID=2856822 RepID=UPI001C4BA346|nr:amidohydrolase family protein [Marinobacter arenosus]MBW0146223.1 amidohydrolase family protein [Marinobacter arenosus]